MHRLRLLLTHRQSALVLLGGLACVLVAIVALATQIADLVPHENVRRLNLTNQLDQVVAAHISGSLRATDRILDRVSSRMLDDPGLWYAPHDYAFERQLRREADPPFARYVLVVDTHGLTVQWSGEGPPPRIGDQAFIAAARQGTQPVFTRMDPGTPLAQPYLIAISQAVIQDGRYHGTVAVLFDLRTFDDVYGTLPITVEGTAVLLMDDDGHVLAHWLDGNLTDGQTLAREPAADGDLFQGSLMEAATGTRHLATTRRIAGSGLHAGVLLPPMGIGEALGASLGTPAIVMTACVIGLALLLTWAGINGIRQMAHTQFLAESANRAKSEFLALMSHELRTPLNAIIGFSEMMEQEVFGPLGNPRYKEYTGDVHESGARLLSIINTILDLSKIEAGKMELSEEPFSLADAVARGLRLVAKPAQAADLRLIERVPKTLPLLAGDARLIEQVVVNLLTNAIKCTEPGGVVSIEASVGRDGGLAVAVTDTGIGMTADDVAVALSPFGQVHDAHDRHRSGTGLGLPLSKRIIEKHGGRLEIASERHVGTRVTATFPRSRTVPGTAPLPAGGDPAPLKSLSTETARS